MQTPETPRPLRLLEAVSKPLLSDILTFLESTKPEEDVSDIAEESKVSELSCEENARNATTTITTTATTEDDAKSLVFNLE